MLQLRFGQAPSERKASLIGGYCGTVMEAEGPRARFSYWNAMRVRRGSLFKYACVRIKWPQLLPARATI